MASAEAVAGAGRPRRYPRLFVDNSALASWTFRARPASIRKMIEPERTDRILHGSDVPVPVTGALAWATGLISWSDWRGTAAVATPIERDAPLKRAVGFGERTFTRLAELLRPTRGRRTRC